MNGKATAGQIKFVQNFVLEVFHDGKGGGAAQLGFHDGKAGGVLPVAHGELESKVEVQEGVPAAFLGPQEGRAELVQAGHVTKVLEIQNVLGKDHKGSFKQR